MYNLSFLNFIEGIPKTFILFFQNSNVHVISQFQWLISAEGFNRVKHFISPCQQNLFLKFEFGGSGLQPDSHPWVHS